MKLSSFVLACFFLCLAGSCTEPSSKQSAPETPHRSDPPTAPSSQSSFPAEMEKMIAKVFPEFKRVKMDPMDAFPVFQSAAETAFFRLQRTAPVPNKIKRQSYPRILLKTYAFRQEKDLKDEVHVWLNSMKMNVDSIQLGQAVDQVKSPPLLCGIAGLHFYIVQAACIYDGPEWQQNVERFFEEMIAQEAGYAWEISCDGGAMRYRIPAEM